MSTRLLWCVIIAMLVVALSGQALADHTAAGPGATRDSVGAASFAFLHGLRSFGAAVLWNRLEPQYHAYYEGSLDRSAFMLPTLRLVTWLDPHFVEAYSLGPWIVYRRGDVETAIRLAMEGVEENPRSGLLHAQLAQLLFIEGDVQGAHDAAVAAASTDAEWRTLEEQHDAYAILRDVFQAAADIEGYEAIMGELERIDAELHELLGEHGLEELHEGHGHDHDHAH